MRTLLGGTTLLLGVIALLGCEEPLAPGPGAPPKQQAYREADLSAIKERWQGLKDGGSFAQISQSNLRAAAVMVSVSTELFPDEWIVDARTYGSCDVFDLVIPIPCCATGAPGDPGPTPPPARATATTTEEEQLFFPTITILDCVDRIEQEPGHFHVGAVCVDLPADYPYDEFPHHRGGKAVYVRAGDRFRDVERLEEWSPVLGRFEPVAVTINEETWSFGYDETADGITLRWAFRWDPEIYNMVRGAAERGAGALTFSITHDGITDTGRASIQSNDADAHAEHTRRCSAFPRTGNS